MPDTLLKTGSIGASGANGVANHDATQTALAGKLAAASNLSDVADAATARANLGVEIGTDVQAFHANLAALAALSIVADRLIYGTGAGTVGLTTLTVFARTLLDDADAATARGTLGLGTAATSNTGDFATAAQGATADSAVQPGDARLLSDDANNDLTANLKAWAGSQAEYDGLGTYEAGTLYLITS